MRSSTRSTPLGRERRWAFDPNVLLQSIPSAVFSVDERLCFSFANPAAEQLLGASWNTLAGRKLSEFVASHATILALVRQVQAGGSTISDYGEVALVRQVQAGGTTISDYGIELALARGETVGVDCHVCPVPELPENVLVVLHPCSVARRLDQQIAHRRSTRSVAGLAATLAHEVKNPLSGIRGAAQLLEPAVGEEDKQLIQLICDETDRICALVERMEEFGDTAPVERGSVNIHQVLEHVRRIASRRLRPPPSLRRALRSVAARGGGRSRPAGAGVLEPGQERGRGHARPRAARSPWRRSTSTGCAWR